MNAPARQRVLVLAHAHPDFSLGGGEIAAYQLYRACLDHPDTEAAWFVAAHGVSGSGALRLRRHGEYLWDQRTAGNFLFKADNPQATLNTFRDLIETMRPTVVFMHHYVNLGLEILRVLRECVPQAKIVLTLHEMLAICQNDGQMVKTGTMRLCENESPEECHRCFPERSAENFWLRKRFIMNYLGLVDRFVTPSAFLRQRYINWGLPANRISVIENGQAKAAALPPRPLARGEGRGRFAFFGQVNPYKGIDVLLEALCLIPEADRKQLSVEIHGANLEQQKEGFRDRVAALREPLEKSGVLHWVGPYGRADLGRRMARADWVLVPSVWWENSPMVIQEAFTLGRPVVCSGIGGMAEKVRNGVDGIHVEANNPYDWAQTMVRLARDPAIWERLQRGIRSPSGHAECASAYLALARQGIQAPATQEASV